MVAKTIGNYKLLEKIGEGGMGEVYKALDLMLEREVALKFMRSEYARQSEIVERFRKEAIALAKLNHSSIATLYNFVPYEDTFFMVMEFAKGQTLDQILAAHSKGLPWQFVLSFFGLVLKAIDHAHQKGIVHRDIKPSNIMLSENNEIKVLDFGIARLLGSSHLTRPGQTMGTMTYMSPEQIQGHEVDSHSDIYSLGIVLFELLAGQVPFQERGDYALMKAHIERPAPCLSQFVSELPKPITVSVSRALEKQPYKRFQTAEEFLDVLEEWIPTSPFIFEGRMVNPQIPSRDSGKSRISPALREHSAFDRAQSAASDRTHERVSGKKKRTADDQDGVSARDSDSVLAKAKDGYPKIPEVLDGYFHPPPKVRDDMVTTRAPSGKKSVSPFLRLIQNRRQTLFLLLLLIGLSSTYYWAFKPESANTSKRAIIESLLQQAESAASAGDFLEPEQKNVLAYAEKIFELDADNIESRKLISDILRWQNARAEQSLKAGDLSKAKTFNEQALKIANRYQMPDQEIKKRSTEIEQEREHQVRLEEEQAERDREAEANQARDQAIRHELEKAHGALDAQPFESRDLERAVDSADAVLKLAPNNPDAMELLAGVIERILNLTRKALSKNDFKLAARHLEKAEKLVTHYGLQNTDIEPLGERIVKLRDQEKARLNEEKRRAQEARIKREAELRKARRKQQSARKEADPVNPEIDRLLRQAKQALSTNRLTLPAGQSASDFADQVLKLAPGNREARDLLQEIVGRLIALGELALADGKLGSAEQHGIAAESLIQRYHLSDTEYYRFLARMKTLQLDQMFKKQTESNQGPAEQEAPIKPKPRPEPGKRHTFIPPSF